jgi:hypothetical protein
MRLEHAIARLVLAAGLGSAQAALAQAPSLVSRETLQSGNFIVGFATLGDSGSDASTVTLPDAVFSQSIGDSGAVNGLFGNTPVAGSGSFSSFQAYEVGASLVRFEGSAASSVSTPYAYVSVGANALSQLELVLELSAPTAFELRVDVVEVPGGPVNGLTPRADALVKLSGPGDNWLFNTAGSFVQAGVLGAGLWRINAFADTRGDAGAAFLGRLALAPVPEPASAVLALLGLGAIGLRRAAARTPRSKECAPAAGST